MLLDLGLGMGNKPQPIEDGDLQDGAIIDGSDYIVDGSDNITDGAE